MQDLVFRQFEKKDVEAIFQLHIAGLKQTDSYITDQKLREKFDKDLHNIKEVYLQNAGEFLVATLGGEIVAMGGFSRVDEATAELRRMRVKQEFQGEGIGSLMLDKLITKAKKLGYKKLILDTFKNQTVARKLYASRGFEEFKKENICGKEIQYHQLFL